ncbi:MAG: GGDEF domain-containing protein [Pseudobutyrivibrio sp.]|nr:GGDEF domain-containing protein [Pseudobutyrivibrio sp.]
MKSRLLHQISIEFFDIITEQTKSSQEMVCHITKAIDLVADILHIAKVEYLLEVPRTPISPDGIYDNTVLFYSEKSIVGKQRKVFQFDNLDKSHITLSFSCIDGYSWDEIEEKDLYFVAKQIFSALERLMAHANVEYVMLVDYKTGIPNQQGLKKFIIQKQEEGYLHKYDALYFNIHNFKYVNKVLPYEEADIVLAKFAQKVAHALSKNEMVARNGGDSFVALVLRENIDYFVDFLQSVCIEHQFKESVERFNFRSVAGGCQLRDDMEAGEVFRNISIAYQNSRKRGYNLSFFSENIYEEARRKEAIVAKFSEAIHNREFYVMYQPKVSLCDNSLCGAEALVRWRHNGIVVSPGEFIPALEEEGSVTVLDYYVLEYVCRFISDSIAVGRKVVPVSVNFSKKHMLNVNLVRDILDIIDKYNVPHNLIDIELTESEEFSDYNIMEGIVEQLQANGIVTSMDDFGTGYSSLSMLKKTKLNTIKIDKSFIPLEEEYPGKEKDLIMFKHLVQIAQELGMNTIAEGVEKEQQLKYLQDLDCNIVQGFVFDKPLEEKAFIERLENPNY